MKDKLPLKDLQKMAIDLLTMYQKNGNLKLKVPIRSSSNIKYDKKLHQYVVGEREKDLDIRNIAQSKPFTQRVWLMWFIKTQLLEMGHTASLRDLYYSAMNVQLNYAEQGESNKAVEDIEAMLSIEREALGIVAKTRGTIFGELTAKFSEGEFKGKRIDMSSNPEGQAIGSDLALADFVSTKADKIIVVEKNAMFKRFIEFKVHEKQNALIMGLEGQPPRNARLLARRITEELNLPCYVLVDNDVWGESIAFNFIFGSASTSHLKGFNVPKAQWIGAWREDIVKYGLPSDPLDDTDLRKVDILLKDQRYQNGRWKTELESFKKFKRLSELEAFSAKGLPFIVEKYLPDKFNNLK